MMIRARLIRINCFRDILATRVGHGIQWTSGCWNDIAPRTSRFPISFSVHVGGAGYKKKKKTTAGWWVTCSAHLEYPPNCGYSDSSVHTGKFLRITVPFLHRLVEVWFMDHKTAHPRYLLKWNVNVWVAHHHPKPSRKTLSSPTKHYSRPFSLPNFQLQATTGLISRSYSNGLCSLPERSCFLFPYVSRSLYLLI